MSIKKIGFSKKPVWELEADALLNFSNTDLIPQPGSVFEELVAVNPELVRTYGGTTLKLGTATVLEPGTLSYKNICHLAIAGIGNDPSEMSIRNAMRWGFQLLMEARHRSFVVPSLTAETGGMPTGMIAEILLRELVVFAESKDVDKVTISIPVNKIATEYKKALKKFGVEV